MNKYLSPVGSNLAAEINTSRNECLKYLRHKIPTGMIMICERVTTNEVIKIVCLDSQMPSHPAVITLVLKLLKSVLSHVIDPLLYIPSLSFQLVVSKTP